MNLKETLQNHGVTTDVSAAIADTIDTIITNIDHSYHTFHNCGNDRHAADMKERLIAVNEVRTKVLSAIQHVGELQNGGHNNHG